MKKYMELALAEAEKAASIGEVPIGAVIVKNGRVIAKGHNLTETLGDPTAHAEMNAIRAAARAGGRWGLSGSTMYVTCEPCSMCAGAIVWARIDELYIGTMDPKAGACGSVLNIVCDQRLNHQVKVTTGIMREECSSILKRFFKGLREKKKKGRETEDTHK